MHQVYDDEMTFKLVAAASTVSGLPVEVCLEEFGKHFLVYCQKNGYDQILRVLGIDLYEFLTSLDNLHDHLASIYPGMRAPSFRVTRLINTNKKILNDNNNNNTPTAISLTPTSAANSNEQQQQVASLDRLTVIKRDDDDSSSNKQNTTSCSKDFPLYLHYYSERAGLSPIVKGLVMAVAREFFQTDITVTECKIKNDKKSATDTNNTNNNTTDNSIADIDNSNDSDVGCDSGVEELITPPTTDDHVVLKIDTMNPSLLTTKVHQQQHQPTMAQSRSMLNVEEILSTNARDSLVDSEIMMQTFPFNVIFDRDFNIVQIGKSLLRVTSLFWQRRAEEDNSSYINSSNSSSNINSNNNNSNNNNNNNNNNQDEDVCKNDKLVKLSDLFDIVRPKIEFTFDAIADHKNQVFVVKTKPLVLNADYCRMKRLSSGSHSTLSSGSSSRSQPSSSSMMMTMNKKVPICCPMDRIAMNARNARAASGSTVADSTIGGSAAAAVAAQQGKSNEQQEAGAAAANAVESVQRQLSCSSEHLAAASPAPPGGISEQQQHQQYDELGDSINHLGLRLKGQMVVLLEGELCLYLCSPRVDHLDQLHECGVKMSDFALHDRARELMLMSHTHKEDREAVKKLDQASNDLKKMDTKLRQENKRTNEVLHNIFPAKIASLLSHGHKVESESFDLVTCLYSDIIGFTKMCGSENVKPIDIVRLLNTLYLQFDNLTNIHEVFKVETIGDAYVVVGGLPEPVEDHADRCVKMGLDMVKVIATVRSPADGNPIQMRIGIHSGPVMAGIVGIRVPRYSLFGNTTTLANQLETHGIGGKIHISDFTLKNLIKRDLFVIEHNQNQINSIPFTTYFVTNYLGDEKETLKHEKILEEQLIKDFKLMGNKLELVDDSYQLYSSSVAASVAEMESKSAVSLMSTECDHHHHQQQQQHHQLAAQSEQLSLGLPYQHEIRRRSTNVASSTLATTTTTTTTSSTQATSQPLALSQALVEPNPGASKEANREHFERLILMDIEGGVENAHVKLAQVEHEASELSALLLAQAIEQVASGGQRIERAGKGAGEGVLSLLVSSSSNHLDVILCRKSDNHSTANQIDTNDQQQQQQQHKAERTSGAGSCIGVECPLCLGLGLAPDELICARIQLAAGEQQAATSASTKITHSQSSAHQQQQQQQKQKLCESMGKAEPTSGRISRRLLVEWLIEQLNASTSTSSGSRDQQQQQQQRPKRVDQVEQQGTSSELTSANLNDGSQIDEAQSALLSSSSGKEQLCATCGASLIRPPPAKQQQQHERQVRDQVERIVNVLACAHQTTSSERRIEEEADAHNESSSTRSRRQQQQQPGSVQSIGSSSSRSEELEKIELTLNQLSAEKQKLERRADRLRFASQANRTPQNGVGVAAVGTGISSSSSGHRHAATGNKGQVLAADQTLSSSMQRMKRMDTLKRRKLKKNAAEAAAAAAAANNQLNDDNSSLTSARQLNSCVSPALSGSSSSIRFSQVVTTKHIDIRPDTASPSFSLDDAIAGNSAIVEEEDEDEDEEFDDGDQDGDDDDDDQRDASRQRPTAAIITDNRQQQQLQQSTDGCEFVQGDTRSMEQQQQQQQQQQEQQHNGTPGGPTATSDDAVEQHEADKVAPSGGSQQRRGSAAAYAYQNFRSSIVSLMNEVSQQSRKKKSRLFSSFTSSTIVSALSSPIRRARTPASVASTNTTATTTNTSTPQSSLDLQSGASKKLQPTSALYRDEIRKHSWRSQSSAGSQASAPASPSKYAHQHQQHQQQPAQQTQQSNKTNSSCSCLRSSDSDQSFDLSTNNHKSSSSSSSQAKRNKQKVSRSSD